MTYKLFEWLRKIVKSDTLKPLKLYCIVELGYLENYQKYDTLKRLEFNQCNQDANSFTMVEENRILTPLLI